MMTKQEFLDGLAKSLLSTGSERLIRENLSFYNEYIDTEVAKGRSIDEVMNELGEPRLIANSIKEAAGIEDEFIDNVQEEQTGQSGNSSSGGYGSQGSFGGGARDYGAGYGSSQRNYNGNYSGQSRNPYEDLRTDDYNRNVAGQNGNTKMILYGVLGGLAVVLILLLVLATAIFRLLAPFLFPIIVLLIIFRPFRKR